MANEEREPPKIDGEEQEEDPEAYVMLSDMLKEQAELEDQSIAVYGASDEKFCSYDEVSIL